MKLTMRQKIFAGMVALAAVAFAVDRAFFSPAPTAAAASFSPPAISAIAKKPIAPSASPVAASNGLADLSALSERLQKAAVGIDPANAKDAFQPSPSWLALSTAKTRQVLPSAAERFQSQHKLLAVMSGSRGAMAIIDGKTLRLGQVLDGFALSAVREQSVIFTSADEQIELQIQAFRPRPGAAAGEAVVKPADPATPWGSGGK